MYRYFIRRDLKSGTHVCIQKGETNEAKPRGFHGKIFFFSHVIRWRTLEAKPNNTELLPRGFHRKIFFFSNIMRWKIRQPHKKDHSRLQQSNSPSTGFCYPRCTVLADHV